MTAKGSLPSRLVREPLLHFLVLGAGLFLLYGYVGREVPERRDLIVVDAVEIARLSDQFQRTWMRPPSRRELSGLAEEFVKEEILYREALALGLDQDDLIIRRRMRQKMEFVNADLAAQREPTDAELQAYLDATSEQYLLPARYSFRQVFIKPETTSDAEQHVADLLGRLRADPALGADPGAIGDPTLLPPGLKLSSKQEIAAVFGDGFADALSGIENVGWSGPYRSSYGLHLVELIESESGHLPTLERIRPAIVRDWSSDRRLEANKRFYQALRQRYSIEIELPEGAADENKLTALDQ